MSSLVSTQVLEPYASALMSIAQSQNLVEPFSQDIASLLSVLRESGELQQFLSNPLVKPDIQKDVVCRIVGDQVHPLLRNFLLVLVDRRRIAFLEGICLQFQALVRQLNQTVLAEAISVVPLNEGQRQAVIDKVVQMTGARQVELETHIDPDLIGGVIIKVGSQVIDASLRGQLRQIGLRLNKAS
jgi:F-type H+-transporting ATPase subunit delta